MGEQATGTQDLLQGGQQTGIRCKSPKAHRCIGSPALPRCVTTPSPVLYKTAGASECVTPAAWIPLPAATLPRRPTPALPCYHSSPSPKPPLQPMGVHATSPTLPILPFCAIPQPTPPFNRQAGAQSSVMPCLPPSCLMPMPSGSLLQVFKLQPACLPLKCCSASHSPVCLV